MIRDLLELRERRARTGRETERIDLHGTRTRLDLLAAEGPARNEHEDQSW